MSHATRRPAPTGAGPRRAGRSDGPARRVVRGFGELVLTLGLAVLLFVGYELYVTDWFAALEQQRATAELNRQWDAGGTARAAAVGAPLAVPEGEPFAKLTIPAFGADYSYTVLQGASQQNLETGPTHYTDTAMPGRAGNFALAGHRVGTGSPFLNVDELASCDALVVETARAWFVYKVLPLDGRTAQWSAGRGALPRCSGVAPLPAPYQGVSGRSIVDPSAREVIAPVPGRPQAGRPAQPARLITLTTCHPKFSAAERMIIHGVLTETRPKPGPAPDLPARQG